MKNEKFGKYNGKLLAKSKKKGYDRNITKIVATATWKGDYYVI